MKLYIRQKVLSLTEKFAVTDPVGTEKYLIRGDFWSLGHRLHVTYPDGVEVAEIREQVFTLMPRFTVTVQGREIAQITKAWTLVRDAYHIDGLDWDVQGNFWGYDYDVTRHSQPVASIHRAWMSWGDCYELDIAVGNDELMVLAVVLAIHCVLEGEARHSHH